ncbi:hypothetical protein [Brevundimonas sp.]|uniref:hypothetical protein n=1 Tax=Brevundimonas sp. TaxID=1871086 RepID=UPI002731AE41|nr:hypothetical protein [Brevundimonas sp.]MDP1912484.1 hypothetical protein [Brevundimonas sp.]
MSTSLALTAVLPLVGILIGAGLQYFFGRSLEARKHIQTQKGQAYADYFKAFSTIATVGRTKETLSAVLDAKTRICVYGSDEVVKRLAAFERSGATTNSGESHALVAALLSAMRQDVGASRSAANTRDVGVVVFGSDWRG